MSEPLLASGDRLGPYRVDSPLGAGGMGEVYRAFDTRLGRPVAVKILSGRRAHDADRLHRFEQETRVVASLSHANVLALHDVGSQDGVDYAVFELLEGQTSPRLREAQAQLTGYLAGTRRSFDLSLDLSRGTSFQQKVWRTLRRVSYGRLRSYQWVAVRVGGRQYARAVGNAVGANPMPIMIPCHRIVAQDTSLGGFSGGLPTKRKLLTLEGTLAELQPGRS